MSPSLSAFIDLYRVTAAMVVLFGHLDSLGFVPLELSGRPNRAGHDAVIVFFVLSGLVIAHAAATSQHTARAFMVARASRLYSVAVPAVLIGYALDRVGVALDPAGYPTWQHPKWALHMLQQWLFLGETWTRGSIVPFSNVPYWSLGYEAWYYLLFGVATFTRGPVRVIAVAAVLAAMGPKLWLLLPAWLAGVVLYHAVVRRHAAPPAAGQSTPRYAVAAIVIGVAAYVLIVATGAQARLELIGQRMLAGPGDTMIEIVAFAGYSRFFLADWVTTLLVALVLYGVSRAAPVVPAWLATAVATAAGISFTLYLLHYPILMLLRATHVLETPAWTSTVAAAAIVLAATALAARLFEHRREPWRRLFGALWDGAQALRSKMSLRARGR